MRNVAVVVDGLNVFHALRSQFGHLTEIDIVGLANRLIDRDSHRITEAIYYSAKVEHLGFEALTSQQKYFDALSKSGMTLDIGEFKNKSVRCSNCGTTFVRHEEKQTDVKIALKLAQIAASESADMVLLFSADTDLIPAIRLLNELPKPIDTWLVSTKPYLRPIHSATTGIVAGRFRLNAELVEKYQF